MTPSLPAMRGSSRGESGSTAAAAALLALAAALLPALLAGPAQARTVFCTRSLYQEAFPLLHERRCDDLFARVKAVWKSCGPAEPEGKFYETDSNAFNEYVVNCWMDRGEFPKAERLLARVVEDDPENVSAVILMARLCDRQGKAARAREYLAMAAERAEDAATWALLAGLHRSRGDFSEAERAARKGLARASGGPPAVKGRNLGELASSLRMQGKPSEALRFAQQAYDVSPSSPGAMIELGMCYDDVDRFQEAELLYLKARASPLLGYDDRANLALGFERHGKLDEAHEQYSQLVRENEADFWAWNRLGRASVKTGALDTAESAFNRAMRLDQASVEPYYNLLRLLARRGAVARMDKLVRERLDKLPSRSPALRSTAWSYLVAGDPAKAARYAGRLKAEDPKNPLVWSLLAEIALELADPKAAEEAAWKALELDGKADFAWNLRGLAMLQQGRSQEALRSFQEAARLSPRSGTFHGNAAQALRALGREKEFKAAVAKWASLASAKRDVLPESPEGPAELAELHGRLLGEFDRCREAAAEATDRRPSDPEYQHLLAWCAAEGGDVEAANPMLAEALRGDATLKRYLSVTAGLVKLRRGDGEGARRYFDFALKRLPQPGDWRAAALFHRAESFEADSRPAEACKDYGEVARRMPWTFWAARAERRLKACR